MGFSSSFIFSNTAFPVRNHHRISFAAPAVVFFSFPFTPPSSLGFHLRVADRSQIRYSPSDQDGYEESQVEALKVPDSWSQPSKAMEESEWLRVNLRKWLDDEYCPEETNVDISNVAASSFYNSLVNRESDLGDILLKLARDLELSVSYQESFHGAFSSANAAVNLIINRMTTAQE